MRGDKFVQKLHADQLQKQLDEDYVELMKEEQRVGTHANGPKVEMPEGDIFEYQRLQKITRAQQRKLEEENQDYGPHNRRGT